MSDPRLSFHGAARGVTGSCFRLQTASGEILIDCGMFQGPKTEKELNYRPFPFDARRIRAVVLTHAHIDHSGLLPKLVRDGFSGPIHATPATADLCEVMLPDSAHIQSSEVEHLNRRKVERHSPQVQPIYDQADAMTCLGLFDHHPYGDWFTVLPDLRARFWNAGHLLGSASVEIELAVDGTTRRLLFSGDIGPNSKLMEPDPTGPAGVDYIICESTYGDTDRDDTTAPARRALLRDEVLAAMNPEGVLLIPSFAVERAQELLSDLRLLMAQGDLPRIPIYIDSPMATAATRVFARHAKSLEGGKTFLEGLRATDVHFTESVEQSMALDRLQGFHIVIAASGMCEAGRIRHRLRNWLWRDAATVLLVGFQAAGTLGRILQDGAPEVRIQGRDYAVRARIRSIDLYSGHADGPELQAWIEARKPLAAQIFLVHGEPAAIEGLADRLRPSLGPDAVVIPALDATYALGPTRARLTEGAAPRVNPACIACDDWHNDASRLSLALSEALARCPDDAARAELIARMAAALHPQAPDRRHKPRPEHRHRHHH
ncbi:MBL fold metallo-hydrolase RNA specificity domain-containing protein [Paragemmobacter straminiformis]|uniref:MBL fold metallo-hydrolase n=1 Tax=Paragemmobacter straminiformis TaxID=2045119 RepID=A0A842I5X8_9RHOB|nr:MBL fold metallo-hydrolase [Gemmobacter straminiformis]MBC2835036.1 MBL fold metallo-hydrolase [Gemmobacter straminiformis]